MVELVDDALALLAAQSAVHLDLLTVAFGSCSAMLDFGAERTFIGGALGRVRTQDGFNGEPAIVVEARPATLVAMVDERLHVTTALADRRLKVRGARSDLRRAGRACDAFLHGLVRCRSAPTILHRLRALASRQGLDNHETQIAQD